MLVPIHCKSSISSTAPVHDLEILIDRCAGIGCDLAVAGDIAPGIKVCAAFQRNAAARFHLDLAIRAGGLAALRTGTGVVLPADADGSLNRNGSVFFHRQLPESGSSLIFSSRITRHIRICRPGRVKGDQQRDPCRNGIIAIDGAVACQGDGLVAASLRIVDGGLKTGKGLIAHLEGGRVHRLEPRRDGAFFRKSQRAVCHSRKRCFSHNGVRHIIPAKKTITRCRIYFHQNIAFIDSFVKRVLFKSIIACIKAAARCFRRKKCDRYPRSLHGELFRLCVIHKLIHKLLRVCRHGQQPGGQKAQRHQQGQGPRKEALEVLFHSFFSPLIFLFCLSPSRRGRRARERQKRDMGQGAASLPHVGSIFV